MSKKKEAMPVAVEQPFPVYRTLKEEKGTEAYKAVKKLSDDIVRKYGKAYMARVIEKDSSMMEDIEMASLVLECLPASLTCYIAAEWLLRSNPDNSLIAALHNGERKLLTNWIKAWRDNESFSEIVRNTLGE